MSNEWARFWKSFDGLFKSIDRMFGQIDKADIHNGAYRQPGAPLKHRRHQIISSGGHISINGDFKSLTINGKLVRFNEEKKK